MDSVLVTGATGFFGRHFIKHLLQNNLASRICIYSRDEHKQAVMCSEMSDSRLRWFIGDVRDKERLRRAMEGCDVVVHAAALKRIEVGFNNPSEMVKTNVHGAMNVIEAATDAGVQKVIALSTDKAWQPISPYGTSKAMAETLILGANQTRGASGPRFSVTRYGNIWRSTGSVVPKWEAMIKNGASVVTVTDEDCTRFFMKIEEAIDLVMDTIETMPTKPAIPKLPAYRLGDLVVAMGLKAKEIGLPIWEKLHEGMDFGNTSDVARRMTVNELRGELIERTGTVLGG